jgi:ribonucleoside-diphosphate reductase alpha chain
MSNLCSEILQVSEASEYNDDLSYKHHGQGHLLQSRLAEHRGGDGQADFGKTIETSIRALTAVSDMSHISSVPSIEKGNDDSHAIGLGQMNLHGYLARERIITARKKASISPTSTSTR